MTECCQKQVRYFTLISILYIITITKKKKKDLSQVLELVIQEDINISFQTPPHTDLYLGNIAPFFLECLCKFYKCLYKKNISSYFMAQTVPQLFYMVNIVGFSYLWKWVAGVMWLIYPNLLYGVGRNQLHKWYNTRDLSWKELWGHFKGLVSCILGYWGYLAISQDRHSSGIWNLNIIDPLSKVTSSRVLG